MSKFLIMWHVAYKLRYVMVNFKITLTATKNKGAAFISGWIDAKAHCSSFNKSLVKKTTEEQLKVFVYMANI